MAKKNIEEIKKENSEDSFANFSLNEQEKNNYTVKKARKKPKIEIPAEVNHTDLYVEKNKATEPTNEEQTQNTKSKNKLQSTAPQPEKLPFKVRAKEYFKSKSFWRLMIVAICLTAVVVFGYLILKWTGINSLDKLREIVNTGPWGVIIFFVILIAQVIFLPAGTLFFTGSAVVLFDTPLKAWLICWGGLLVGSLLMFFIARVFGIKVMRWIVGEERAKKYAYYLGRGKFVLPMLLLVPIFPDDLICAASGLSNIKWLYFAIVITITRGIDNFCTCFIGAELIKTPLGITILGIFIIAMIFASYFLTKYQDRIELWLVNKFSRKK